MANLQGQTVREALIDWNHDTNNSWNFGTNWNSEVTANKKFETFINNYLFPKLNETLIIEVASGNRFDWLAQETDFIGQYSEEYVILDSVPIEMDLSKNAELMLKRNLPQIATKLYGVGILKKMKFTLNNHATRLNFATVGDAITYAMAVYKKKLSDINVSEEKEIKAMLIDYSLNHTKTQKTVDSMEEMVEVLTESILNLQNNSDKYNEADTASGGELGRFTTSTKLKDILILTTDKVKRYTLNTFLANTFNNAGLDLTDHIISFDDLGGAWKVTNDITVDANILKKMKAVGDYQVELNDIIPKGDVLTVDITDLTDDVEEIKPTSDLFASVMDIHAIRYKRHTKGMLKEPFYNGEFDEVTHWIHYYSFKSISPFYNKVTIQEG